MLSLLIVVVVLCAAILGLLLFLTFRRRDDENGGHALDARFSGVTESLRRLEQASQEGAAQARREANENAGALREELSRRIEANHLAASTRADEARREAREQMEAVRQSVDTRLRESAERTEGSVVRLRAELTDAFSIARNETRQLITTFQTTVKDALADSRTHQGAELAGFSQRLRDLNTAVTDQLDKVRQTLDQRLTELQTQNAAKLDEMRQTVDQRLQATLEQRLGDSFKVVSESLEKVTRSLGEMQQIASGVGDLKRVLTNVKTRGTWSEVQLSALLEQVLTTEQFAANIAPNPASGERVEFAIKLPGRDQPDKPVWLPIDAKFPVEDYQRLVDAADRADAQAVLEAGNALEARIRSSARDISTKYVAPPHTTDFGILYLPTEGLYAEALRRPGLAEALQREHRIVIAGPTTLAALLNSLQMGFRTLAIQQRSSEVWLVLGAVKTEFGKFAEILAKVKKKLDEASTHMEQTGVRSRAIERKLRSVETLPAEDAARLLPRLDTDPAVDEAAE
ncbi:MAG: DNA recombination protein RmuC [Opitutaceae bacterium]|nr:DNA recombination protein RmuC [Opitutaceae bacterium]